ncbi:MAG: thiamine ABC transporter substrate-binding protein [Acidimicrobiales bacterium]
MHLRLERLAFVLAACVLSAAVGSCGVTTSKEDTAGGVTIRLLTHDSFALSDGLLASFTDETGITVEIIQGGDAGTVVNQAILTNGNPQADVLFGIDSTFLTRALEENLFLPYRASAIDDVDAALQLDPDHRVTPIDYGDVCLNYDKAYFADQGVPVPERLADLTRPIYRDLLVVENPATSSPGLAFLLATIAVFGPEDWQGWWSEMHANGVRVASGWEEAYYGQFSGGAGSEGTRPLVVSYASSPAAEVIYADPPIAEAPTGVITDGCYRQVEGAGILAGTEHEAEAGMLIDFLLSPEVQADVPTSMFVYPVRRGVAVPSVFLDVAVRPERVAALAPAQISSHRDEWIDAWTDLVLR